MMNSQPNRFTSSQRRGFTLIEMMVSVVITMIMMFVFARVFALATDTIVRLHAISENDERARSFNTILKGDLDSRTFKTVAPWGVDEDPTNDYTIANRPDLTVEEIAELQVLLAPAERRGYLYISDNSDTFDNDDVLQFTVERDNNPQDWFYGKTQRLGTSADQNQPAWDDLEEPTTANDLGSSQYAEVSYFVRDGILYRRVLLIRKPAYDTTGLQPYDSVATAAFFPGDYNTGSANFWQDFDYSAYHNATQILFSGVMSGDDYLDNTAGASSLGVPKHRFGFDYTSGKPREYVQEGTANERHIGRFTHEETSSVNFTYPAQSVASPFADATLDDSDADGVVDTLEDGTRRGEDILMTNVLSFDVKIWDDVLQKFVDVGHGDIDGGLFNSSLVNSHLDDDNVTTVANTYGPIDLPDNIFDTWHPAYDFDDLDGDQATGRDPAPYRPDDGHGTTPVPTPLKAIQITVRYYDTQTEATRQVSIVQSLYDRFDD